MDDPFLLPFYISPLFLLTSFSSRSPLSEVRISEMEKGKGMLIIEACDHKEAV